MNDRSKTLLGAALLAAAALATVAPPPLAAQDPERIVVRPLGAGGWIGISFTTARLETGARRPVVVITDVVEGSPAESAGLMVGDTLLSVNGLAASQNLIGSLSSSLVPGDEVQLRVRRDGRDREVTLTAGERPAGFLALSPNVGIVNFDTDSIMGRVRILMDSVNVTLGEHRLPEVIVERLPLMLDSMNVRLRGFEGRFEGLPLQLDSLRLRLDSLSGGVWTFGTDSAGVRTRFRVVSPDSLRGLRMWSDSLPGLFLHADSLRSRFEGMLRFSRDSLFGDSAHALAFRFGPDSLRSYFFNDSIRVLTDFPGRFEVTSGWRAMGERAVAGASLHEVGGGLGAALDLGAAEGLLVLEVPESTPAARAGLRAADLIVSAGGEPVATVAELRRAVQRAGRGQEVVVEVLRDRRRVTLRLPGG